MTFRDVFVNNHVVIPVIHVASLEQALRNTRIAHEAAADGVFLINHHCVTSSELLAIHEEIRKAYPDWWIGVNCLDLHPSEVFSRVSEHVAGIWVDNAMIDEMQVEQSEAEAILEAKRRSGWNNLYFGGVAFKYQRHVSKLKQAARIAAGYMDVVTTSGPGTGQAAEVEKIRQMKRAIGDFPLAIASGITPENVTDYLDSADCFLVATGISADFNELDRDRVNALIQIVRKHRGARRSGTPELAKVCFVCEYNEGRSAHLELRTRQLLRSVGCGVQVVSAGLSQGGRVNPLRREYLMNKGAPESEIEAHRATVFEEAHLDSDLVLVAELPMKHRLLEKWPALDGRVMSIRGFAEGLDPKNDFTDAAKAHIEDAGGHNEQEKTKLYKELDALTEPIAKRIASMVCDAHSLARALVR